MEGRRMVLFVRFVFFVSFRSRSLHLRVPPDLERADPSTREAIGSVVEVDRRAGAGRIVRWPGGLNRREEFGQKGKRGTREKGPESRAIFEVLDSEREPTGGTSGTQVLERPQPRQRNCCSWTKGQTAVLNIWLPGCGGPAPSTCPSGERLGWSGGPRFRDKRADRRSGRLRAPGRARGAGLLPGRGRKAWK